MPALPDPARPQPSLAKLTIASIDTDLTVRAQFNPKELQTSQPIEWHEHQAIRNEELDGMCLEFGGMKPETMQIELLFDGYENRGSVGRASASGSPQSEDTVMARVAVIKQLAAVREPGHTDPAMRRPHFCVVTWGDGAVAQRFPRFRCIIESVTTKFLMFSRDGAVLRASCAISLKSADRVALVKRARMTR